MAPHAAETIQFVNWVHIISADCSLASGGPLLFRADKYLAQSAAYNFHLFGIDSVAQSTGMPTVQQTGK
jgi:hypothetical protein